MKITYANQSVELNPGSEIIISLSGGLDSASLTYLILKHFPDTIIWPICGRDVNAPLDAQSALDIVNFLRRKFPKNKLQDLYIFDFDDTEKELVKLAQKQLDSGTNVHSGTAVGVAKNIITSIHFEKFMKLHPKAKFYEALTQNPPIEDMKRLKFYEKGLRTRDPNVVRKKSKTIRPYENIDKKFVASIYKTENLMQTLFTLTGSCTGRLRETNGFTEPCKKCFWCYEKHWAFGEY